MSYGEGKQKVILQSPHQNPLSIDQRTLLIRNVCKHPRLYKNEFLRTPFLHRIEKQQMWDQIAKESGFEKTEDAKCKWRSLISHLRQHMDNVAHKKTRRYIPISDNPDDKYVQLTDWPFYCELEFLVPYVKYAASKQFSIAANHLEITPSEIDLLLEGIEAEIEKKNEENEANKKNLKQNKQDNENRIEITEDSEEVSIEDDIILKEYFENMLKSTLKLPKFHQNIIKQSLKHCINEQNPLNKID